MIRYALKCAEDHRFESWFQSAGAFDSLASAGHLACPICGSSEVEKAIMAPQVASGDGTSAANDAPVAVPMPAPSGPLSAPAHPAEQMLKALREHVEKNSTDVGERFASEARAMHVGDRPEAAIHGKASPEEARALIEDGVPIAPLPLPPGSSGKTN